MKIPRSSIVSLSSSGYITLQVPDVVINFGGGSLPPDDDLPDEWFVRLTDGVPSPQGFLHLSRKGWEANRDALWEAFSKANAHTQRFPGITRAQYEKEIREELKLREKQVAKKIAALEKKIARIKSAAL